MKVRSASRGGVVGFRDIAGIRVAVSTWNGRISPVFDVSRTLLVLEIGETGIIGRREQPLDGGLSRRVEQVAAIGAHVLLCGAISKPLEGILTARGLRVVPCISGEVEEVIRAYLAGTLDCPRFTMPGCLRRRVRAGGGRNRHGGAGRWG
jgi:predicted Fe-Mo cluster-binding NifX family protein